MVRRKGLYSVEQIDEDADTLEGRSRIVNTLQQDLNLAHERFIKISTALIMLPSPVYLVLPYCRKNPRLSLFSVSVLAGSALWLQYRDRLKPLSKKSLPLLLLLLSLFVIFIASLKPQWSVEDVLWFIPFGATSGTYLLAYWIDESNSDLSQFKQKYKVD